MWCFIGFHSLLKKRKTICTHPDGDEEFRIDTEYEEHLEQLDIKWKSRPKKWGKHHRMREDGSGLNIHVRHLLEHLGK